MNIKWSPFRKNSNSVNAEGMQSIKGERSIPPVNKALSLQSKLTNGIGFGFVIMVGIFFIYQYYASFMHRHNEAEDIKKIDKKMTAQTVLQPLKAPYLPSRPPIVEPLNSGQQIAQRQRQSPIFFARETPSNPANTLSQVMANSSSLTKNTAHNDIFSNSLRHSYTPEASARLLPHRNFLITKGTFFDCVMQTAIDTTVPGMTTCMLSQDVYSDNGKIILLERGTEFTGEQKSVMNLGQKRVFILWTRAKTPQGVIVELDSPTTDSLGRSGIEGEIDNHFWDRFGAAIMLSLIDDAMATLIKNSNTNSDQVIVLPNTMNNSTEIMSTILKQTINIPPTLRKNQGGHINIIVARDLDFHSVYDLKVKP